MNTTTTSTVTTTTTSPIPLLPSQPPTPPPPPLPQPHHQHHHYHHHHHLLLHLSHSQSAASASHSHPILTRSSAPYPWRQGLIPDSQAASWRCDPHGTGFMKAKQGPVSAGPISRGEPATSWTEGSWHLGPHLSSLLFFSLPPSLPPPPPPISVCVSVSLSRSCLPVSVCLPLSVSVSVCLSVCLSPPLSLHLLVCFANSTEKGCEVVVVAAKTLGGFILGTGYSWSVEVCGTRILKTGITFP